MTFKLNEKKFIPAILCFIIVSILLFTPGHDLPVVGSWFERLSFDKLVHAGIFAVLSFLFMRPFLAASITAKQKWRYCIKIALIISAWGYLSELIQKYFCDGRNYDILDWAADTLGAVIALIFCKKRFLQA